MNGRHPKVQLLKNLFPKAISYKKPKRASCNLKRDYIDLMQFHVWNDNWANNDEWKEAIEKLKNEGKVLFGEFQ